MTANALSLVKEAADDSKPNVAELMTEIRARIRADLDAHRDKQPTWKPQSADFNGANRKAGELLHSEELRYLNANYTYAPKLNLEALTSHRAGFIGRTIVKVKQKILALVWDFLKDYFLAERDFQVQLVRFLNDVSKYVDARDASNFWELIRKIDYDLTKALERIERIADEQMAELRSSERRLSEEITGHIRTLNGIVTRLDTERAEHKDKLQTLDSVVSGLESILARLKPQPSHNGAGTESSAAPLSPNYSYLLLENRFRGSEAEISSRLRIYPEIFRGATLPVLEIGGGRGELQRLFKEASIKAYAVDLDQAMVEHGKSLGLDLRHGDGVEHLSNLPARSIGGVIAIQVVEHLTRPQLERLFKLCSEKIITAGKVVFETINPRSLLALSSNYFRDPTHIWPLHPDTLAYAMELSGLRILEVRELSPVPEEAQLRTLELDPYMTPGWTFTVETLNRNLKQLNQLIYGNQDYCVIAEVK